MRLANKKNTVLHPTRLVTGIAVFFLILNVGMAFEHYSQFPFTWEYTVKRILVLYIFVGGPTLEDRKVFFYHDHIIVRGVLYMLPPRRVRIDEIVAILITSYGFSKVSVAVKLKNGKKKFLGSVGGFSGKKKFYKKILPELKVLLKCKKVIYKQY